MKFLALQKQVNFNLFTLADIVKFFPEESDHLIRVQLSRFSQRGLIFQIKRGIYCFDQDKVSELELASILYQPSYLSLETALNYYGLIPDIPLTVTSITPITTKSIKTALGSFSYTKIAKSLFFGFEKVRDIESERFFNLALLEKALLDYIYLRKFNSFSSLRLDLKLVNQRLYQKLSYYYPKWVGKVGLNE